MLRTLCSVQNPLLIEFADVYEDVNDVHLVLGLCKGEQRGGCWAAFPRCCMRPAICSAPSACQEGLRVLWL